jgi:hypothetical protein
MRRRRREQLDPFARASSASMFAFLDAALGERESPPRALSSINSRFTFKLLSWSIERPVGHSPDFARTTKVCVFLL